MTGRLRHRPARHGAPDHGADRLPGAASKGQGGVSWTLDQTMAAWFAARRQAGGEDGRVYVAEIAPQRVLVTFHARQENELVINPRLLQHLRKRDGQPPAGEGSCVTHPGLVPG